MTFSATQLAAWSGGQWDALPASPITGFCFDSRKIKPGDLFAALRSETADGHAYVAKALAAGAAGALVRKDWQAPSAGLPLLRVAEPLAAMHAMAAAHRREVGAFVVGVTGSVGKSTVKEWTAALIGAGFPTSSTLANFNNDIGLPVSLLSMDPESRMGVYEIGMNHKGELAPLCRTLQPNAAVITAIGPVHIEFFPSVAAIADEKAELLRALPADGFAVLDADSEWFDFLRGQTKARVVTVSREGRDADFTASGIDAAAGAFTLGGRGVGEPRRVSTGVPGAHNVLNALYAIAAARSVGVEWDALLARLGDLPRMKMRWERFEEGGITWVNDAYNANPIAMASAIRTFSATATGRRVYVLGEMRELGADAKGYHEGIGRLLGEVGGGLFVAVGSAGTWMADAARAAGFPGEIAEVADAAAAGSVLADRLHPGDSVLLKASRGVGMEETLRAWRSCKGQ